MSASAVVFEKVLADELKVIAKGRHDSGKVGEDLFGLALSGGGIRSATFNLGVLQSLSVAGLLRRVDYLSTVSGGGYIGSWLSAWIWRLQGKVESVEAALRQSADSGSPEPETVHWLRRFSNYLTPRTGLLSTDTLSAVATYVRNLLLNLLELIALLGAALILPLLLGWLLRTDWVNWLVLGSGAFALAVLFINLNLYHRDLGGADGPPFYQKREWILAVVVIPLLVAGGALGVAVSQVDEPLGGFLRQYGPTAFALTVAFQVLAWLIHKLRSVSSFADARRVFGHAAGTLAGGPVPTKPAEYRYGPVDWFRILLGLAVGVSVALSILWLFSYVLPGLGGRVSSAWNDSARALAAARLWHTTVLAIPAALIAFGAGSVLFIGIVGRTFSEETREWWSRLGGWVMSLLAGWLILVGTAVYGPYVVGELNKAIAQVGIAWIVSTIGGVIAGQSRFSSGRDAKPWVEWIAKLAPYVFILGLLLLVSSALNIALLNLAKVAGSSTVTIGIFEFQVYSSFQSYADALNGLIDPQKLYLLFSALGSLAAVVVLLALTVDINVFSFHMYYRNRLVRCYLGASNESVKARREHPFTGFDPKDTPKMPDLAAQRPYHLINTALNLTRATNLAWQERKAASFFISPLYCGYDLDPRSRGENGMYQPTDRFLASPADPSGTEGGWLGLGTAMTISGAAASPNMGHHTSPATAILLTVFNVRLGWWMQNTNSPQSWGRKGPRIGIWWLLCELFAMVGEASRFVYLSDGGHFENLGIYELVRRRCRFILAVDTGHDPKFEFEDLGNAVRKCEIDLNVSIDIDTRAIVPEAGSSRSRFHCAMGEIRYPESGGEPRVGLFLYVKPSLTGNEPADVGQYAASHPEFPHQSTSDQWFDESQFESYRKLGQHEMSTILAPVSELEERTTGRDGEFAALVDRPFQRDLEWIFVNLKERWFPPSQAAGSFTRHADQLRGIEDAIRKEKELRFMDGQLLPEWSRVIAGRQGPDPVWIGLPKEYESLRAGFYLCTNMLQLMETVYLDLDLEEDWIHPDNRGWMNLFKHWSWSAMFLVTYSVCCGMYGARFQRWCERRFELRPGRVQVMALDKPRDVSIADWLKDLEKNDEINFVEQDLLGKNLEPGDKLLLLQLAQRIAPPFPPHRGDESDLLVFTFGVAAARPHTDGAGSSYRLTFFRIQDHVRRMGLARRSMRALVSHKEARISDSALPMKSPQKQEIERTLRSVLKEYASTRQV